MDSVKGLGLDDEPEVLGVDHGFCYVVSLELSRPGTRKTGHLLLTF